MKVWLIRTAGVAAVLIGVGMFLLAVTVGDCAAFGGTCPRQGLNDDVLGTGGVGGALVGGGVALVLSPTGRRALLAIPIALLSAVGAGALAVAMTSS